MIFQHFLIQVEMAIGEVNAHLIACDETREALLIDAGAFDPAIEQFVTSRRLDLRTIFVTHEHEDHVAGVAECARYFEAKVIAGIKSPGGYPADRVVKHGDEIAVGRMRGRLVSTPGHTPIALSLIFDRTSPGMIFSGDALFAGSVGGTASKENHNQQISAIREHLFTLPDDYQVHSGHGPATTVGIERRFNPFFV